MYRLESTIIQINKQAIVHLPTRFSETFPTKGMNMGIVSIHAETFVVVLEPDGRNGHWFKVPASILNQSDYPVNIPLSIEFELLDDWPRPTLSITLTDALRKVALLDTWNSLTPKAQWEWFRWIYFTSNSKTIQKRIHTTCDMLKKGKRRPCCFDYSRCTDLSVCKSGYLQITD